MNIYYSLIFSFYVGYKPLRTAENTLWNRTCAGFDDVNEMYSVLCVLNMSDADTNPKQL
jgi:hypothetical protein